MSRLVTISFTGLNAGGGVPKFNRDLHSAFPDRECVHFCWDDYPHAERTDMRAVPEWERARILNLWLIASRNVTSDDVIVADGFWADGLQHLPKVVSHSHGIWSHLTKDDVDAGRQPDMPYHHAAQVAFRKRWVELGKPLTAVSDFIAEQMRLQWGFESTVINNGVDTSVWKPSDNRLSRSHPWIVHGVNDRGNRNKGWDHIELLASTLDAEVMSLDEFVTFLEIHPVIDTRGKNLVKAEALAQADLVVHPSGYEGNSMFVAEALSCGIPIVGYEVGAMASPDASICGVIIERSRRSPETTLAVVRDLLQHQGEQGLRALGINAREYAVEKLSIRKFRENWRSYVQQLEEKHG